VKIQGGNCSVVPLWLLLDERVTHPALRLWAILAALWGGEDRPNPTRAEMAVVMNVSSETIESYLRQLLDVGGMHQLVNVYVGGKPSPPTYCLRYDPPEEAMVIPAQIDEHDLTPAHGYIAEMVRSKPRVFVPSTRAESSSVQIQRRSRSRSKKKPVPDKDLTLSAIDQFPRFVEWWSRYPRHIHRERALRKWTTLKIEGDLHLFGAVMAGLERHIEMWAAERRAKHFIPYASRWLNDRSWTDDATLPASTPAPADDTIWSAISAEVEQRVDRHCYRSWFASAQQVSNGDGAITVSVVSAAWVTKHYTQIVAASAESAGHAGVKITWEDQVGAGVVGNPV